MVTIPYLVVAGSWFAFSAYTWLLHAAPISTVATYAYVNPAVAVFLGWAFLGEPVTALLIVGAGASAAVTPAEDAAAKP